MTAAAGEPSGAGGQSLRQPRRAMVIPALGITQIIAWGSSFYLPAILAKPIADDTGWPLIWVLGGFSFGLLVSGLAAPRVGRAIHRRGGRPVLAASAVLLACGLFTLAAAPGIPAYFAAWAILGLGMGAGLYDAAFSTLGQVYGRSARSAITVLTLWGGFASTVCWPLSAFLVQAAGWRGTCLAYGMLHLALVLPLYLAALPRRSAEPEAPHGPLAAPPEGSAPAASGIPADRALLFWMLAAILTTGGLISSAWSAHLLTILQAGGIGLAAAVALGALFGPAQVGARVVEMLIGRHYHPIWTLAAAAVLIAAGLAMLWTGFPLLAVPLLCFGAGNGIWSIARGTLPLALFGPSGFPLVMGRLAMPSLVAQSVAPSLGAVLLEHGGADGTLAVLSAMALFNVASVAALWHCARRRHALASA